MNRIYFVKYIDIDISWCFVALNNMPLTQTVNIQEWKELTGNDIESLFRAIAQKTYDRTDGHAQLIERINNCETVKASK